MDKIYFIKFESYSAFSSSEETNEDSSGEEKAE